ncbi:MAG: acetate/propionate family kinase [Deltaproteobacteria bacterium HGW-Deltaproteobacteria-10]|nr:MAG: acetate/propionate family kinase [Deltaproteobacteria bacterium HGW-Deltaproteobacteria-10]
MELPLFLKGIEILSDLRSEDLALIAENAQMIDFPDGSVIIKRGEPGRFLWVVYDGEVEVLLTEDDGSQRTVATLEREQIFGEMSLLTGELAVLDVIASHASKIIRIPREIFSRIIAENPKTLGKFTRLVTKRMMRNEQDDARERLEKVNKENEDPYDLNFTSVYDPLKILTVNCGSSSLKYTLFDTTKTTPVIEGLIEKIGSGDASHVIRTPDNKKELSVKEIMSIQNAFGLMVATITDMAYTGIGDLGEIKAVGHRVVHGGAQFPSSVIINAEVSAAISDLVPLAPLHNPYNLEGITLMQQLIPAAQQVAVFDTSFHASMPEKAYTYALPYAVCEEERIRRYGFHGTNHKFVALSAATFLKRPLGELKIISCHLGSGASFCAIDHGQSVDTSMGMTPLEGLIMGTRAGDLDPGIILHLLRQRGMNVDEIDQMLNKKSGLMGLSGKSNDMRTILAAAEAGDIRCEKAISTFCYRARKYIGAYSAALGGLDTLIFTGGIGENSAEIRARICQGMEAFGIFVYDDINRKTRARRGQITDISEPGAKIRILVIPADEEKMIARETIHALGRSRTKDDIQKLRSRPIPLSTSAHHVHLSQEHFEILFGAGRTMTPRTDLSQPGQFAAVETVNLIGPKGRIEHVRILGPARKDSQVEISRTEQFKLGIDPPIRDSGDIEGTPGITIEGETGTVKLSKGVICAKRHIHMSPEEALTLGLRDKDVVMVRVKGVRELIFGDVLVRVHPDFRMDMHLDTDEANAAQISAGTVGYIEAIQHRKYM